MQSSENNKEMIEMFVKHILTTNRGYSFYVNWSNTKAYKDFEIELNAMNVLIRQQNFEETFKNLLKKIPSVICTFPLLFALGKAEREELWSDKKDLEISSLISKTSEEFNFSRKKDNDNLTDVEINRYYIFFKEMGLKDLFENQLEKSVIDYVTGVLVGLDTNGRKNRSGNAFELLCEEVIGPICDKMNIKLLKQKKFKELEKYGFTVGVDVADRKADFILIKDNKVLNIEANYFFRGGSKPEEIIDSYINRKNELVKNNIGFILITDGLCWDNEDKNQLNKAFRHINIMNHYIACSGVLEETLTETFK